MNFKWCRISGSMLVQEISCCLMTVSHYLNHYWLNSLWPSDAIRWQETESILAQVVSDSGSFLIAPSHYLNQLCIRATPVKFELNYEDFRFIKMHSKLLSSKCWPFCSSLEVLTHYKNRNWWRIACQHCSYPGAKIASRQHPQFWLNTYFPEPFHKKCLLLSEYS